MAKIGERTVKKIYEETVETKFAETRWPVYETYQLRGMEGFRYIWAKPDDEPFRREVKSIDPLSPEYASLFLEFARWFDKRKMDKGVEWEPGCGITLDTSHNAEAALAWARTYGVLGLDRNLHESFAVSSMGSNSSQIAAERLGKPELGYEGTRAYRKSPTGGEHETVEMFVLEAYEANIALKLYEAATAIKRIDDASTNTRYISAIARYMSNRENFAHLPRRNRSSAKTERELWSEDAELARRWALMVVEHAVHRKIESDVYPILYDEPYSYKEGWGFKSLLGAMWFQMRRFMLGESDHCLRCGELFPKTRRDRVYCDSTTCGARDRADRQYERKQQRKQKTREATRRRRQQ